MLLQTLKTLQRFPQNFNSLTFNTFQRNYHPFIVDHFENPRNVGSFDKNEKNVAKSLVGSPQCGDLLQIQIKYDPETNYINDTRFKTFGCGSAIASSSVATEQLKNKHFDEALQIKNQTIAKHLSLPAVKLHCSMLAEDAIKQAIRNAKSTKS